MRNNLKGIISFLFFLWEFSLEEKILFLFSFPPFICFSSFIFINGKRKGTVNLVENKFCFSIETRKNRWPQVKMGGGGVCVEYYSKRLCFPRKSTPSRFASYFYEVLLVTLLFKCKVS